MTPNYARSEIQPIFEGNSNSGKIGEVVGKKMPLLWSSDFVVLVLQISRSAGPEGDQENAAVR